MIIEKLLSILICLTFISTFLCGCSTSNDVPNEWDKYVYLNETDLPDFSDAPDSLGLEARGKTNVVLFENKWNNYSVQLVGEYVYTKVADFPESIFLRGIALRVIDDEREIGLDSFHFNPDKVSQGDLKLDKSDFDSFIRVFDIKYNEKFCPLITAMYGNDETGYDTTFYTITQNHELKWFFSNVDEELVGTKTSVAMNLSGDFSCNGENCSLTDNRRNITFSFDYGDMSISIK